MMWWDAVRDESWTADALASGGWRRPLPADARSALDEAVAACLARGGHPASRAGVDLGDALTAWGRRPAELVAGQRP